jgi:hypothetical protein
MTTPDDRNDVDEFWLSDASSSDDHRRLLEPDYLGVLRAVPGVMAVVCGVGRRRPDRAPADG